MFNWGGGEDDDASSVSSGSTAADQSVPTKLATSLHKRASSVGSGSARSSRRPSPKPSSDVTTQPAVVTLYREDQRVSLRAFLRTLLQNPQVATTTAMGEFLNAPHIQLNPEELQDVERRKEMDRKRIEEQKQFYAIAQLRAAELDIYMERFRRDVVEKSEMTDPCMCLADYCRWSLQAFRRNSSERKDLRPYS